MKQGTARESDGGWLAGARRRLAARNDAGISMVELIVAVVIIAIVLLSGTTAIDFALSVSNAQRLKVEATNLAVTSMERDEQLAASLGIGTKTATKTINTTTFTVVTAVTDFDQNGSQLTTVCTSSGSSVSQQIWQVTVTITWPDMNGAPPVTQSTEVAPGQVNALDLTDGEIAVAVNGTTGTYLTTPLNFTVTPQYIGQVTPAPAYPTPSGQTDPAGTIFNTGSYGCGVVTGLATNPSWNYVVTLVDNPGWVSSSELSDVDLIGGNPDDPTQTLSTLAGEVSRTNPPFQMALGVTTTITLQPVSYSCSGGNPGPSCYVSSGAGYATPVAPLPVTFGNSSLPNGQYTFGSVSSGSTELLYPYASYDVWSGDMAQSNPGATVTGTGTLIYTGPGSDDDTPAPVLLTLTGGTTAAVSVPTYDLSIQVTSACAGSTLVATEQSGSDLAYDLNPLSGSTSASGMPLGQYLLSVSGSCTLSSANGLYVWVTPTGVYQSATEMTSPYTGTAVSTTGSVQVTE
ncbi:MAG TPA: prepilin-type N-terminal cleavage/methylation domain-containing protein [Acidimicrobiales bacterium]|nr:prepilin-type N-terminal cleavage/methylation domain-containing protein [Acidimicrobiales bacterium]